MRKFFLSLQLVKYQILQAFFVPKSLSKIVPRGTFKIKENKLLCKVVTLSFVCMKKTPQGKVKITTMATLKEVTVESIIIESRKIEKRIKEIQKQLDMFESWCNTHDLQEMCDNYKITNNAICELMQRLKIALYVSEMSLCND